MINTPHNRLSFIVLTCIGYLLSPLLIGAWLYWSLINGEFPTNADSIGLPFAGFLMLWIIGFPFLIIFYGLIEIIGKRVGDRKTLTLQKQNDTVGAR